jgi:hypothetical protein
LIHVGLLHDVFFATKTLYRRRRAPASGEKNPGRGREPFRRHLGTVYRDEEMAGFRQRTTTK